ncbi:unnamed protein product, partial [Prorocentrum cordatum]
MVLTSYLSRICLLTSLFGMTAPHSAGAVSLAFRPAESSMSWSIANKTDTGKENVSAQLSIARTVRDMAQEYGYEADRSRSEVRTWMYVTSVAWIAVLVMRLCYPTAYTSVELMFASAQLRAKQAGAAARHSARSPHPRADVAGTTNDFLTRVATDSWGGTQPAEQRRAVALEPTWLCRARAQQHGRHAAVPGAGADRELGGGHRPGDGAGRGTPRLPVRKGGARGGARDGDREGLRGEVRVRAQGGGGGARHRRQDGGAGPAARWGGAGLD